MKNIDERQPILDALARNLKRELKAGGLKQQDLAKLTGIAGSHISGYCNGKHEMGAVNLKKIADALGVSLDTLMAQGE